MARTSATITVGADTRQLERDIQSALSRDFKFKGLNEKAFTQPLGRITGASNEFQKSLDASNARVIAFGASAGAIYAIEKAFVDLIKSTVDVQKSLTDINVILNTTSDGIKKFGDNLFTVAKDTSQSFQTVAQAATELARQGLGVEETLKRTRDALILTRLSGLDTVSSVEALTATLNSFSKTALTSTDVINKLANVDAAFAVSSADLANAVQRVGSSAQDAGVGFDELLAIVTSVQQTTARGGAVIGNSLKTIFTRISRPEVLDQLQSLGLEVRDLNGETKPAIGILQELASRFDSLSQAQKSQIAESVGGVFQINILKAALGDLGKEYSIYNNALNTSAGATDEAIKRNQALNETLSSLLNRTLVNFSQLGAKIGAGAFQPALESTLKNVNVILESIANQDTESVGTKIGKGILGGLSTFISGPGLLLITAVIGKLFLDLTKFAATSTKTLLGLNKDSEQRAQIQTKISSILAQEPQLLAAINAKQISVLDVENKILNILREQTLLRQQAAAASTAITAGLISKGVGVQKGQISTKSQGFIPNFVMEEILGAAAGGYRAGNIKEMNIPGVGKTVYNSAEKVKKFPGFNQPAIMPPESSKAGKNYKEEFFSRNGFNPYASQGLIPNYAAGVPIETFNIKGKDGITRPYRSNQIYQAISRGEITSEDAKTAGYLSTKEKNLLKEGEKASITGGGFYDTKGRIGIVSVGGGSGAVTTSAKVGQLKIFQNAVAKNPELANKKITFSNIQLRSIEGNLDKKPSEFTRLVNEFLLEPMAGLAQKYLGTIFRDEYANPAAIADVKQALQGKRLLPATAEGSIFEAAVNLATKKPDKFIKSIDDDDNRPFDFEETGPADANFKKRFGFSKGLIRADAKLTGSSGAIGSVIKKAYNSRAFTDLPYLNYLSQGFIPNFSDLKDAIKREMDAGVDPRSIRIGQNRILKSDKNPMGLGVYNTKDEPKGLYQGISRFASTNEARKAGASQGFIPNYALQTYGPGGWAMPFTEELNLSIKGMIQDILKGKTSLNQAFASLEKMAKEANMTGVTLQRLQQIFKQIDSTQQRLRDETNKLVNQASQLFGSRKAMMELERRAAGGGAGAKMAQEGLETVRNRRQAAASRFQGIGIGASIAVPMLTSILQEFMPNNKPVQAIGGAIGDTAAYAGAGSLFGPWGAAIGGLIGATIGLTKAFKTLNDNSELYAKNAQTAANRVARFSEDVQAFTGAEEKITGIESGTIKARPEDYERLQKQRDAALARIYSSVSPKVAEAISKSYSEANQVGLEAALQDAQDEIASSNFVSIFVKNINDQLKNNAKDLDLKDTLQQFSNIKTKTGKYIGDLIAQNQDLVSSVDVVARAGEKYISLEKLALSINGIDIATQTAIKNTDDLIQKLEEPVKPFAGIDLKGGYTTSFAPPADVMNPNEARKLLGDTQGDFLAGVNKALATQSRGKGGVIGSIGGGPITLDQDLIEKDRIAAQKELEAAYEVATMKLSAFVRELGAIGELKPEDAAALSEKLRAALENTSQNVGERIKALDEVLGQLGVKSEKVRIENKRRADSELNLANLLARTNRLFSQDVEARKEAAAFIQKGNFGRLVKDFLQTPGGTQFNPENMMYGTNAAALQGILAGTTDLQERIKLEEKFGETYKKAAQEVAETGNLSTRTYAELQIAVQKVSTEASISLKNMTDLGVSIGDLTLSNEALNLYTEKESKLKKELGDNVIKLNYATSAAADSLKAIAGFKEGTLFADEYKQLQNAAREKNIRAGKGNVGDMFGSFSDEMTYGTQDAFRDLNAIGSDTARTLKSEFNNAFQSIIDGTAEVGDAFRQMALNMSRRIQQLALEMTTNLMFNSLFSSMGGLPAAFKNPLGRSTGGIIKGYSTGGKVLGGSGMKDDVPAMLSKGEYVIRKSAVNKYGSKFLESLNNGGIVKAAEGGDITEEMIDEYYKNSTKTPASETDPGRTVDKSLRDQLGQSLTEIYEGLDVKYSSAFSKLASSTGPAGGEFKGTLAAYYAYNDGKYPTAGRYVIDPLLSQMALFDENDPQNQINQQNRENLASYLAEGISIYERNREAVIETIKRNQEEQARINQINQQQQDAFNNQQKNALIGAFVQAGLSIGAGAFSTYGVPYLQKNNPFLAGNMWGSKEVRSALPVSPRDTFNPSARLNPSSYRYATYKKDGGPISFARGGMPGKDNVPALLMGGEYVIKKDAVDMYGKSLFDDINRGRIRKFANGGMVGTYYGDEGINAYDNTQTGPTSSAGSNGITNNINISVALTNNQENTTSSSSQEDNDKDNKDKKDGKEDLKRSKELAMRIRTEVVKVINQEQRPGGLLSSAKYSMKA